MFLTAGSEYQWYMRVSRTYSFTQFRECEAPADRNSGNLRCVIASDPVNLQYSQPTSGISGNRWD